jgi:hypothetical protein
LAVITAGQSTRFRQNLWNSASILGRHDVGAVASARVNSIFPLILLEAAVGQLKGQEAGKSTTKRPSASSVAAVTLRRMPIGTCGDAPN